MTTYTRPADGSRPIPDVLLTDPASLSSLQDVTSWARALTTEGLNCHPDDSGESIVSAGSGEYLFTSEEARLYDALMERVFSLRLDDEDYPHGLWLRLAYEAEGIDVCEACGFAYMDGPVGACCEQPTLKPRPTAICRHCDQPITAAGFGGWTHDGGHGRCSDYGPLAEPKEV